MLKSILCLAVIAALLPLMSCDNSHPPELAGHWLHESGSTDKKPEDMELLKDGTGVCDGDSISWKAEDKRLMILSPTLGFASDYEVAGYRLALTDKAGKSTYVNINEAYYYKRTFTDSRDSKTYKWVKIGTQTWMAENLNYKTGNSRCFDDYNQNCDKYGRLYDWNSARNACPAGWHLPSDAEWGTLVVFAGDEVAGKKLKARIEWDYYEMMTFGKGNGTDDYGFSALPCGYGYSYGGYGVVYSSCIWWSSTEYSASYAYARYMYHDYADVVRITLGKTGLYSVRCVKD